MRTRLISLCVGIGAVVVACVATRKDDAGDAPGIAAAPSAAAHATPPAVSAPAAPVSAPAPVVSLSPSSLKGPRVFDWTSSRVTGRATRGVSPADLLRANGGGIPGVDWNIATGAPVTAAPAVYGSTWVEMSPNESDMLFFGVNGTAAPGFTSGTTPAPASVNNNFFALTALYTGSAPVLSWSTKLNPVGGVDGNAVALSSDGTKVYVVNTTGHLFCFTTAGSSGSAVSCGAGWPFAAGAQVHNSGPWIDYTAAGGSGDIYFGDDSGTLHRVNGTSGAAVWGVKLGQTGFQYALESSPVVYNGYIYIGDDGGQLFQVTNTAASAGPSVAGGMIQVFPACQVIGGSAPCPGTDTDGGPVIGPWAIRTAVAFDTTNNHVYFAANDYVIEMNGLGINWTTPTGYKHLNPAAAALSIPRPCSIRRTASSTRG